MDLRKNKIKLLSITIILIFFLAAETALSQSYTETRAENNVQLGIAWGPHFPTLYTFPLRISYGITGSLFLSLEYGLISRRTYRHVLERESPNCFFTFFCPGDASREFEGSGEYINRGTYLRYYPGDTFYILVGYHERKHDVNIKGKEEKGVQIKSKLNANSNVFTVGLGNQWSFNNGFFIETSWITASYLSASTFDYKITETYGLSSAEISEWEKDIKEYGNYLAKEDSSIGIAILTIGFAF